MTLTSLERLTATGSVTLTGEEVGCGRSEDKRMDGWMVGWVDQKWWPSLIVFFSYIYSRVRREFREIF